MTCLAKDNILKMQPFYDVVRFLKSSKQKNCFKVYRITGCRIAQATWQPFWQSTKKAFQNIENYLVPRNRSPVYVFLISGRVADLENVLLVDVFLRRKVLEAYCFVWVVCGTDCACMWNIGSSHVDVWAKYWWSLKVNVTVLHQLGVIGLVYSNVGR